MSMLDYPSVTMQNWDENRIQMEIKLLPGIWRVPPHPAQKQVKVKIQLSCRQHLGSHPRFRGLFYS